MLKRMIVNLLLLVCTLLEFSKVYLTPEVHEIIGIVLLILMVVHVMQNRKYIQSKQKTTFNILYVTNILLFVTFITTIITGLLSSQLIPMLNIHTITTNYLHKILAYITFLLISLHLGLNINKIIITFNKKVQNPYLKHSIFIIIIIVGIISFIQLDFFNHLIGNVGFSTNNSNIIINILQYLSILLSITLITNYLDNKIKNIN
ncbi:MAG: DUF4405 domain-containing protein [Methanosphaera stadtmanae]|nr:DUF4405 domain-containing protein [Methanosphaera stadtmanae]